MGGNFGTGHIRPDYVAGCQTVICEPGLDKLNEWFSKICRTQPGIHSPPKYRSTSILNVVLTIRTLPSK